MAALRKQQKQSSGWSVLSTVSQLVTTTPMVGGGITGSKGLHASVVINTVQGCRQITLTLSPAYSVSINNAVQGQPAVLMMM